MSDTTTEPTWRTTACILCESNCGIEVRAKCLAAGDRMGELSASDAMP
jgi:hypothetical protein